jgi:cyclopropane-fatty-acyl-phospholipid synthase
MMSAGTLAERQAVLRTKQDQREHERVEVAAHYEHDPEIFARVLDSQLAYSTGIFLHPGEDLETAQQRKFAHILDLLAVRPGEAVLDVGCGWGSILLYLAQHTQGLFRGLTLSAQQRAVTLARARERGLSDRVQIDLCHVQDLAVRPASIDVAIFSGSIVHMHNREEIYDQVGRALRPGGRLLVSDCFFPKQVRGNRNSDATHYIFVKALGYCRLLGLAEELAAMEQAGLDIRHVEDLSSSYVLTLGHWIDNVRRHREWIEQRAPGFAQVLQGYMTVAKLSFDRRTALEYMILAIKGRPHPPGDPVPVPGERP